MVNVGIALDPVLVIFLALAFMGFLKGIIQAVLNRAAGKKEPEPPSWVVICMLVLGLAANYFYAWVLVKVLL